MSQPVTQPSYTHDDDIRAECQPQGDVLVYDPFNVQNQLIGVAELQNLLSKYGIDVPIHHWDLYKRAFIHRSYVKRPLTIDHGERAVVMATKPANCLDLFTKSNERLEFVGDGVLECITKFYLYRRFPKKDEGFMTEKKIALVKNESIGKIAYEMGLHKWFVLSRHAEQKNIRTNLKKLGCLFEAFLGALFLDFNKLKIHDEDRWFDDLFTIGPGFQMAQIFVERVFEKHVDWIELINTDDNFKNIVQVKMQKEFKKPPHYLETAPYSTECGYSMGVFLCLGQTIHQASLQHAILIQQFTSFADIHEYTTRYGHVLILLGEGQHKIKKKAEQMACEDALRRLQSF